MNVYKRQILSFEEAKPYRYSFQPSTTALVLIDLQRDFVDPNGFGAVQCGNEEIFSSVRSVVGRAQKALDAARQLGLHVFHTREGHRPDLSDLSAAKANRQRDAPNGHHTIGIGDKGPMGRLLVRGEYGHDIVDELRPHPGEVVIDKPGKGSFWATDLHRKLTNRAITHLIIAGVTTECCVTTTAREANDRGFQCCVLTDCTSGFDSDFVENSLAMIRSFDGLFGFTCPSNPLLSLAASSLTRPPSLPSSSSLLDDPLALVSNIPLLQTLYSQDLLTPTQLISSLYPIIESYISSSSSSKQSIFTTLLPLPTILSAASKLESLFPPGGGAATPKPPLYGLPFAIKDNISAAGIIPTTTTAGLPPHLLSSFFSSSSSQEQFSSTTTTTAPCVSHLLSSASSGALLIGTTNLDQLATGLSGCRSPYGVPVCPFPKPSSSSPSSSKNSKKYITGGSSSGSALATSLGFVSFALGTDTAGSGRVPAALNGIAGWKPTRGLISTKGVIPACRSLDVVSVFSAKVEGVREVAGVLMEGQEEEGDGEGDDEYTRKTEELPLRLVDSRRMEDRKLKFGVPPREVVEGVCETGYVGAFYKAMERMIVGAGAGAEMVELTKEEWEPFRVGTELLYGGTLVAERVACIGEGFLRENLGELHPTTAKVFGQVLEREGEKAWHVFRDQARQRRATWEAARLFKDGGVAGGGGGIGDGKKGRRKIDVLVTPTTTCHPTVEEMEKDPIKLNARLGEFTHFGNVLDLCAVSLNAEFIERVDGKMPFGISLVGAMGMDGKILELAEFIEETVAEK